VTDEVRYERRVVPETAALERLFDAAWGNPKRGYERVFGHSFTEPRPMSSGAEGGRIVEG
jgi:hypothetical protein